MGINSINLIVLYSISCLTSLYCQINDSIDVGVGKATEEQIQRLDLIEFKREKSLENLRFIEGAKSQKVEDLQGFKKAIQLESEKRPFFQDQILSKEAKAIQQQLIQEKELQENQQFVIGTDEEDSPRVPQNQENLDQERASKPQEITIIEDSSEDETRIAGSRGLAARLRGPKKYDSRIEVSALNPLIPWQFSMLINNESVGMIVEKEKLIPVSSEVFYLDITQTLGKTYNLCNDQSFHNQPVVGIGTCFIVDTRVMITAKHVFERPIEDYAIVFGYRLKNSKGVVQRTILKADIYYPKKVVEDLEALDIIKFQVDRPLNRPPLNWEPSKDLEKGTEIYMIGHPTGLPKKNIGKCKYIEEF